MCACSRVIPTRLVGAKKSKSYICQTKQVVSCLRRLEILALEEKTEKNKQRQRALARQADVDAKGSPLKTSSGGSKREAGATGAAKIGGGGGVSQRQLALVEMKLQVCALYVCVRGLCVSELADQLKERSVTPFETAAYAAF